MPRKSVLNPVHFDMKSDALNVTVYDGKYTVKQTAEGKLLALRYGDKWRDLTGDGLVLALASEVKMLQKERTELKELLVQAYKVAYIPK